MAVEIGSAYLSIFPRFKDLGKTLKSEMDGVDGDSHGHQVGKSFVGGFGKGLAGLAVVAGGAFAALNVGSFLKGTVDAASDMNETLSKSNTIFGDQGKAIEEWANTSAKGFGQSKQQALEAAGTFGNLFKQLGVGSGEAAKMSKEMVGLASDFASFHNADPTEVLEAMTAAFRGEYDAVQRYVPTITAATVEQKALSLGLAGSTKELDAQDKALATQALLMEGAGDAVGDFARTSDGLANQQRILNALWQDAKVQIGTALLPAVNSFVGFLVDRGIPALLEAVGGVRAFILAFKEGGTDITSAGFAGEMERLGLAGRKFYDEWKPRVVEVADALKGMVQFVRDNDTAIGIAAGTLATFLGTAIAVHKAMLGIALASKGIAAAQALGSLGVLGKLLPALASPVGLVVAAIVALGVAFYLAYTKIEPFREVVDAVARAVWDKLVAAFEWVRSVAPGIWETLKTTATTAFNAIKGAIGTAVAAVEGFIAKARTIYATVVAALQPLIDWFKVNVVSTLIAGWDLVMAVFGRASAVFGELFNSVKTVVGPIIDGLIAAFTNAWTVVSTVFGAIRDVISFYVDAWLAIISTFIGIVGPIWTGIWNQVWNVVSTTFEIIKIVIETVLGVIRGIIIAVTGIINGDWSQFWDGIKLIVSSIWEGIKGIISAAWDAIKDTFTNAIDTVKNTVTNGFDEVVQFVGGLPRRVLDALGNLGSVLFEAGKDLVRGFVNGIKDMASAAVDAAKSVIDKAKSAVTGGLLTGSPSKVFHQYGLWTIEGYIRGLEQGNTKFASRMDSALAVAAPTVGQANAYAAPRMTIPADWVGVGQGAGGGGITNVVNVTNPIPKAGDVADALAWASRTLGR